MSWGLGWKRPSDVFHLSLYYGTEEALDDQNRSSSPPPSSGSSSESSSKDNHICNDQELGFRIDLDWNAGDDDVQVALRLQSQVMVALPLPQDTVVINLWQCDDSSESGHFGDGVGNLVGVRMKVVKQRDPLKAVAMSRVGGSSQQYDGMGVLTKLLKSDFAAESGSGAGNAGGLGMRICADHWMNVTVVSVYSCGLSMFPVELTKLPLLEKLFLDNNKLSNLPSELGDLKNLKVLTVDYNILISVPVELRRCVGLVELSVEHNKLVCPLLDFRAMAELRVLRLFGNPLEFLPEILPLHQLRHLSLANIRIVADDHLRSVNVQIEMENSSYFVTSRHKLSAFFALIFRFSSCHHPLLASALAKMMQDEGNRVVIGKDENAVRQLISMISSENQHVVEQAGSALTSLASDVSVSLQLMKCDIMQPIQRVMKSVGPQELKSVLQIVAKLGFVSDTVAQKMMNKDVMRSLKLLCAHKDPEVQRSALLAIGNLAFCVENRRILVASESLRDLLLRLTVASELRVRKAAARVLAILGENESLRRFIKGRQVPKQGLRILTMDGGGMKGLATVQILKEIEKGTGKQIHEMFDLICGTSTGGMLAVALGIKLMSLEKCEEMYKNLGKLVFAEPVPKDNEAATWREKFDQLYKSSSQSFRVVVHGSKHCADEFERLLKEICAEEDGDLLIDSAVKKIPKVIVVSTLVSVSPAQPYIFRNYQYPSGTLEAPLTISESLATSGSVASTTSAEIRYKRGAYMGSCRHHIWQAIRASSAAPYYLDDYSDGEFRWQDGAIVANNPTVFAIREAQLLWPDAKIDTLVSIGCCSVPIKVRRGGWRYLDTGQVLVESACSIERVEDMLSTLLSMIPEIQYFRFNPVDERCDMELDETDPTIWLKLEAATNDYIQKNSMAFKNVSEKLLQNHNDDKLAVNLHSQQSFKAKRPNTATCENGPSLGWRRNVLLVKASNSPDPRRNVNHVQSLERFCCGNGIRISLVDATSGTLKPVPGTSFPSPFSSPLLSGSFPSSPLCDLATHRTGRTDIIPHLSLDGNYTAKYPSPPESPTAPRQLSTPIRLLHEKLQNSPRVGVVHLALQNDTSGSVLSWQNDVYVIAEPSELAEKFLQNVKYNFLSMLRGRRRRYMSEISNISTVADLVACRPCFQIGVVVHRYIGRQTQVIEEDQEIAAYMFHRTVPFMHLSPADVRWMVGGWRDRIIIYTGLYGPSPSLIKAFLDSGAKAVICPSADPHETQLTSFHGSCETNEADSAKFEIGVDEVEDEDVGATSPMSDWEDIETTPGADRGMLIWDDDDEEELAKFIRQLYDLIHLGGARVDVALQQALAAHRTMRYSCHLPRML
ncbi:phospholipase A I-like isoform X2 [Cynara cardunculus var. scolymus]|uniref:phospholipase A I-like isoform X2 n=1 Tax=Cynara cardunculus var. scolymus TaxID=59895 RepID=UPI000D62DD9C|nr:phospholipase A I-like isoform X2 [Cynara cardunculus var. scolymus]